MSPRHATTTCDIEAQPDRAATQTAQLTVELRPGIEVPAADAAAFDALIERRPHVGVFLSKAWLSGYLVDPPRGFEAYLLLFREGSELRGIAPIALSRTRTQLRVSLMGGGLGSDRVDLLTERGFEGVCADRFVAWLGEEFGRRSFVLQLRDVPAESPLWGAIYRTNAERTRQFAVQPREVSTLPYLDLADSSALLTTGSVQPRNAKSLSKHRRWLERRGRLRVDMLRDPDEVLAAFDSLTEFLHARWRGTGEGSVLDSPHSHRFHRHVIPLLLADGRLRMVRLSVDARTVAVFYGLASQRWWGYYLAGYDRDWAGRIRLGQITLATAIELASRDGVVEFDFLKGAERVKYLWPVQERASLDADLYSERPQAQLARFAWATREAASAIVKSARVLF